MISRTTLVRHRGLALIEILICSSIAALMLTATAVAFRASVMTFRDSTDRNMLLSQGGIALRQLIQEIRQADAHGPINDALLPNALTLFAQGQIVENGGIQILKKQPDADDPSIIPGNAGTYVLITWQFDPVNHTIVRTRSVGSASLSSAIVARYVTDFRVRMEPARSAANIVTGNVSFDLLQRAVVSMTLQNRDASGHMINDQGTTFITERLVDAAVPRRHFSGL